ncbi:SDR family oxidoreductase [Halosquirtibacter xylanolyticus]|uniref:SDR family oxidoreductase n=1 Tax=Halosquirtibacter xylanolyticus TaxID=3374599 RepID=UPI0037485407|nr:SDR family oxidoreductase [Prolixibacteraceae bacterium]
MRVLITGATGYIGKRLINVLLKEGHQLYCTHRGHNEMIEELTQTDNLKWIKHDFLDDETGLHNQFQCDVAYYLIHAMKSSNKGFESLEIQMTKNFLLLVNSIGVSKIIYLSGIVNTQQTLSPHFRSRFTVEKILNNGNIPVITLRAGIIVGSGSASFEIIRDLVEKLPIMVAPKWLLTRCQPISIRDVLFYLAQVIHLYPDRSIHFDIGGPEVLTYKQMLIQYAEVRSLHRYILTLPVMTPRLSSYWLYFVTSTSYNLAINLVESMKIDVVCHEENIKELFPSRLLTYKEAVKFSLSHYDGNDVVSKWSDAHLLSNIYDAISEEKRTAPYGAYQQLFKKEITKEEISNITEKIWAIGGENGWYYGTILWRLRAFLDKLVGGVGYRKRNNKSTLNKGEALDFWRIIEADKDKPMLTLIAEMKLPGTAMLKLYITYHNNNYYFIQNALFYPHGLWGRIYWWLLYPVHVWIFKGMARKICAQ